MEPAPCKHFELEIVDHILGNLPGARAAALHAHLAGCGPCRRLYAEWRRILEEKTGATPSSRLYRRLKRAFQSRQLKRRLLRPSFLWGAGAGAIAAALLIALAAGQFKRPLYDWEQPPAAAGEMPLFVVNDAKTVPYAIAPQKGQLTGLEGYIWVNDHSDEIYFYIQGLEHSVDGDYQIWLIKPVRRENGGLLQVTGQYGALHLQQRNLREVQQISISLEPKGGSLYPTGEDTILVDFMQ